MEPRKSVTPWAAAAADSTESDECELEEVVGMARERDAYRRKKGKDW